MPSEEAAQPTRITRCILFALPGSWQPMSILRSVPSALIWLFWLLVAIILILLAALLIHHLGGFDLAFNVGHFRFNLGVT